MKNKKNESKSIRIDLNSIFKDILKNSSLILMCACIAGIWSFIFFDRYWPSPYVSKMNLVVIARGNETALLNEMNMKQAVERGASILNSEALTNQVRAELGQKMMSGTLSAAAVSDSNVITLSAKASRAEDSFAVLSSAIKNYPSISSQLIGGYYLEPLGELSMNQTSQSGFGTLTYALLTTMAMLMVGIGVTALLNIFSGRLHNEDQAREYLDADFLGRLYIERKQARQGNVLITNSVVSRSYVEEIEKLTTKVIARLKRKQGKTFVVTSVLENEGKSTISVNLALALAQRGKRVLLLEGDFRKPALFKLLDKDIEKEKEMIHYLSEEQPLEEMLTRDKTTGCYYCLSRGHWENSEKLLESEVLVRILRAASAVMDYVLIDTSPAGMFRDAEILAGRVDGTLLVVQEDRARAQMVNDVVDRLEEAGNNVLGYVFNRVRRQEPSSFANKR